MAARVLNVCYELTVVFIVWPFVAGVNNRERFSAGRIERKGLKCHHEQVRAAHNILPRLTSTLQHVIPWAGGGGGGGTCIPFQRAKERGGERQTDRQTNRQTDRDRDRQRQ